MAEQKTHVAAAPPPAAAHAADREPVKPAQHGEPAHKLPKDAGFAGFSPEELATPPTGFPFVGSVLMKVTLGPWAGSVLHFPEADADKARSDKWAVDHAEGPIDENASPPAMTQQEIEKATADAQAYFDQHNAPPTEERKGDERNPAQRRDMHGDTSRGGYETKRDK